MPTDRLPSSSESLSLQSQAKADVALVIIDMLLAWPASEADDGVFLLATRTIADNIAELKARCEQSGMPIVYVNDNAGRWRSDLLAVVQAASSGPPLAQEITMLLAPTDADYVVIKPKHSGFFQTPLELLLRDLGVRRLILAGVSADQCVMATAIDAKMRDFDVEIAMDCIAAPTGKRVGAAVKHFQEVMELVVRPAADLELPPSSQANAPSA